MIEEKIFVDFMIIEIHSFLFSWLVLFKQNMHAEERTKEYINTTVNARFSLFVKIFLQPCFA